MNNPKTNTEQSSSRCRDFKYQIPFKWYFQPIRDHVSCFYDVVRICYLLLHSSEVILTFASLNYPTGARPFYFACETPYSRMNEAQINKNCKRIVYSNDKFLEITWWYQDGANNHRSSTQKGPTQSDKAKNKSLVPIILEHGDQRPELNPKIIPLSFATSFTTIYPEISLAFELCHR